MAVKGGGRRVVQVVASLAACLCQGSVGHCVPLSAYLLPQLEEGAGDSLLLTPDEGSWFASMFVVGSLTGSLVGGYQCGALGRRLSMMLDCLLMAAGLLTIGLAPSTTLLLIGRLATGHSAGSNLVSAPIFVSEISHPDMRGSTSTLVMTCYTLGFFLSMLLGAALPWRTAVLLYTSTPLLSLAGLTLVKESPSWLLRKGRREEARSSLMFYRGCKEEVRVELTRMEEAVTTETRSSLPPLQRWASVARRAASPQFLKPFLLLNLVLNVGLEWAGFPALAFYMHSLLAQLHLPVSEYWVAVCLAGYRSLLVFSLSFIMYKAPRRRAYLSSGVLVVLGTATLGAHRWVGPLLPPWGAYLPLGAILLMYTGFGLGYGPICFMLQGEILPADLRGFGSSLLGILDNISLFVSVKLVPTIISSLGLSGAFLLYCSCCCFTLITAAATMPETKGLSLEEIEESYKDGGMVAPRAPRARTVSLSTM